MSQQGDVLLCQSNDGGEIEVEGGLVTMSGGLPTAVYLSLFGGNADDGGEQDSTTQWWGNLNETLSEREYRSETQFLLGTLPATSFNLRRIEDAAKRDLKWLLEVQAASSIEVAVTVPALNRIKLTINIEAIGEESTFEFVENWKAAT